MIIINEAFQHWAILSPVVPAINSINKGEKMGWFTMPVLYSILGVLFMIGMCSYLAWFFISKMKEEEAQKARKEQNNH